jgi:hypothetical protein
MRKQKDLQTERAQRAKTSLDKKRQQDSKRHAE